MGHFTYLLLELAWALPAIAGQWALGHRLLRARWRVLVLGAALPTCYLSAADALAIRIGIWTLSPELTLGLSIGALPLEEAVFFLVTNIMVVQGLIMLDRPPPASPTAGRARSTAPEPRLPQRPRDPRARPRAR